MGTPSPTLLLGGVLMVGMLSGPLACESATPATTTPPAAQATTGPAATVGNGDPDTTTAPASAATATSAAAAPPSSVDETPAADAAVELDGFAAEPVRWPIPRGPSGGGFNGIGGLSWFCLDLDGDDRVELVWTGLRRGTDPLTATIEPWIASGRPHWRVYRNTGAGFERDATTWRLPPALREQPGQWTVRNETHALFDVDGDARPDLVLTGEVDPATMTVRPLYDDTGRVEWRVFINRGDGFAGEPRHVDLPDPELTFVSRLSWRMLDMDGDDLLDLVVMGDLDAAGNFTVRRDAGGQPHWRIYRNTSTPGGAVGFASAPLDYALPNDVANPGGDLTWLIEDLDGDGRLDLTQTGQLVGGGVDYNTGNSLPVYAEVLRDGPRTWWRSHRGGAQGFGPGVELQVPEAGHRQGYGTPMSMGYSTATDGDEVVSALWSTFDFDGDGRVELVDYGYAAWDGGIASWGEPGEVWWKVYRLGEHGFSRHYDRWRVPAEVRLIGAQAVDMPGTWLVTDVTGDSVIDLVLPSLWTATREGPRLQVRTDEGKPYWLVYPGQARTSP